jgi:post-segregation antitoxin (ccd killing protein)
MAKFSFSPEVIREVKAVEFKVSSFDESKLCDETHRSRDQTWNERHVAFFADYGKLIEKEGVALEDFRTF